MMTMRKLAARLLSEGKTLLADTALDLDTLGVQYAELEDYAKEIGVTNTWFCSTAEELLSAIVALEQQCMFS